jgi:hypothetical protein
MNVRQTRGKCEGCDKEPRVLTQIESGQLVCRTCLREIRTSPTGQMAKLDDIQQLRNRGFDVHDDLTQEECERLQKLDQLRSQGLSIVLDTPYKDVERLCKWLHLPSRAIKPHLAA